MATSLPPSFATISPQRAARLTRLYSALGFSPTEQVNPATVHLDHAPIAEQLALLNAEDASVPAAVAAVLPQLTAFVEALVARFQQHPNARLIYVGAGTSGRLGVLDAAECVPTFGIAKGTVIGVIAGSTAALENAIEGAEDNAAQGQSDLAALQLTPIDTVVGISASGGAAYVRAAVQFARHQGCLTAALVNNPNAPLLEDADHGLVVVTGPEPITGSTRMKAGTSQKLVLNMISTALMVNLGRTYGNVMVDVQPTNAKLRQRAIRLTAALAQTDAVTAQATLESVNYQVKLAVAMLVTQQAAATAQTLLNQHNGQLWRVLDSQP